MAQPTNRQTPPSQLTACPPRNPPPSAFWGPALTSPLPSWKFTNERWPLCRNYGLGLG
ncbi:hypothetical protein Tco_0869018, partial [Tanacetum coccineum]